MKKLSITCAALLTASLGAQAAASTYVETGDAGQSIADAQSAFGATTIEGMLDGMANTLDGNDADMFAIQITDTAGFSASVMSDINPTIDIPETRGFDNDTDLLLLDAAGEFVLLDEDSGDGLRPEFFQGDLTGLDAGLYYLVIGVFATVLGETPGTVVTAGAPPQFGSYSLSLTGVSLEPGQEIPLPGALPIFLAGAGIFGAARAKARKRAAQ